MGGRPLLVMCERVLFTSTFAATDDDLDADYCRGAKSKMSKNEKEKLRSSQMLSTSSVRSSKRVRLASLVAGSLSKPPTLKDSSGGEYDPPTKSASKTLESRYSCVFLYVSNVLYRE